MPLKTNIHDISTLTFYSDQVTATRRSSVRPRPQTKCVKGDACNDYVPRAIQCTNTGSDAYGNVQWKCEGSVPGSYVFGRTQVVCEGWNGPGDSDVVVGSCGVEYELFYASGNSRRGTGRDGRHINNGYRRDGGNWYSRYKANNDEGSSSFATALWIALALYIAYTLLRICFFPNTHRTNHQNNVPPRTGAYDPSAPPASSFYPQADPPPPPYTSQPHHNQYHHNQHRHNQQHSWWMPRVWGWTPTGFITGWAASRILEWMFPGRDREEHRHDRMHGGGHRGGRGWWYGSGDTAYPSYTAQPSSSSNWSSWFGNTSHGRQQTGHTTNSHPQEDTSRRRSGSAARSDSSNSDWHTTTGYGGTTTI